MVLGIYGSGGVGREVKEIAEELGQWDEIVFIDDTVPPDIFRGIRRMPFDEFTEEFTGEMAEIIVALGEPKYKINLYEKVKSAGFGFATVIHPSSIISKSAKIGKGVIVKPGALISSDALVENNVSIEEYAIIGHDSVIHKHAQISSFVMIAGHCEVGEGTYIAISVPVRDTVKIGAHSVIGMGSVVQRDIPDGVTAMGSPARPIAVRRDNDRVFR